ncbi:MAG TPA: TonB-dependent receptor [Steroidobacteraceae bacterium]|jgi:outer membrane receptor protein involved in Fe transport|nr:TonB-dependent receptor [Steroidobacteraceae bacterium]
MKTNHKIHCAVAAILAASATTARAAEPTTGEAATETTGISEVVVTAQRRTENAQDVPITIQALTAETLAQLKITTFEDVAKFLPNVTSGTYGPGQNIIYMRGLGTGALGVQGEGSVGIFPNVAVYLDEQSAQLPSRNLDVYAVDLERIEVLEGPQGTLFGAGAQAGVIRYITNKPKLNTTEAYVNASYSATAHGDPNTAVDATINLPLIDDTLAVRAVIFNDARGGYINNVPTTFTRSGWDLGLATYNGGTKNLYGKVLTPGQVPADAPPINNYLIAANDINSITYQGIRASLLWKINDNWEMLLAQTYQNMDAEGVFYSMPSTGGGPYGVDSVNFNPAKGLTGGQPLPQLSVSTFTPSYNKDKFTNTAWTFDGLIGPVKTVYAGAYLVRNVEQQTDYTNYARGLWGYYYQCTGFSKGYDPPSKCYSPAATWTDTERLVHQSHELRFSTPDDLRIRGLLGLYYEKYSVYDDTEWLYRSVPECSPALPTECYLPIQPWPGAPANRPEVRNSQTGFFDDVQRGYKQKAAFLSVDFDLIPKVLTLTGGVRYFRFEEYANGGDVGSFYCKFYGGYSTTNYGPCTAGKPPAGNNNAFNHQFYPGPPFFVPGNQSGGSAYGPYGTNLTGSARTETGTRSRANLSWKVTDTSLLYYTFSQGYRPGGFNRGSAGLLPVGFIPGVSTSNKCGYTGKPICQFYRPLYWSSDNLTNNEVGWKTEWFDRTLLFNGAIYQEKWTNVQTQFFDPQQGLGNLTFNTNGPDYKVKGIEIQFIWQALRGLTFSGAAAWNSSEQTNSPALIVNNPYAPGYGSPVPNVPNVYGAPGSRLAMSPPFEGNIRARYEWPINAYHAYVQAVAAHIGETISQTGNVSPFVMPGYTTYDASCGIGKDAWLVEFYGQNLSNNLSSTYTSSNQFVVTETTLRPRILGLKFSYAFRGH